MTIIVLALPQFGAGLQQNDSLGIVPFNFRLRALHFFPDQPVKPVSHYGTFTELGFAILLRLA
jgi:hypothetical protein